MPRGKANKTDVGLPRADLDGVGMNSTSAGLDPADVLTILSHTSCSPETAIQALLQSDGDVVNAVMNLTGL